MVEREEARAAKDFARADEIRDRLAEMGWEVRDSAEGPRPRAQGLDGKPDHLRASAGRRGGAGEAARCTGSGGRRRRLRRSWSGSAGRRTTRGWSPRSIPIPTATPAGMLRGEDALLVALDQVQDPRNLGAVCRSAEVRRRRRADRPRAPRRGGDRGRLQGLCRRGRAPPDRPRPQPRRLARRREGGRLLDLGRRRRGRGGALVGRPDRARPCSCSAARAKGCGPGSPPPATASSPFRSLGKVDSLNVSAAATALLFEAVRQRS